MACVWLYIFNKPAGLLFKSQYNFSICKIYLQIILITIPGFCINYTLILWYLTSVDKLHLRTTPWLLFSAILLSSDPMLTAAAIRNLGRYIFSPFLYLKYQILYLSCIFLISVVHCFSWCEVCHWGIGTEYRNLGDDA